MIEVKNFLCIEHYSEKEILPRKIYEDEGRIDDWEEIVELTTGKPPNEERYILSEFSLTFSTDYPHPEGPITLKIRKRNAIKRESKYILARRGPDLYHHLNRAQIDFLERILQEAKQSPNPEQGRE